METIKTEYIKNGGEDLENYWNINGSWNNFEKHTEKCAEQK